MVNNKNQKITLIIIVTLLLILSVSCTRVPNWAQGTWEGSERYGWSENQFHDTRLVVDSRNLTWTTRDRASNTLIFRESYLVVSKSKTSVTFRNTRDLTQNTFIHKVNDNTIEVDDLRLTKR